jgi:hypothetical protein
VNLWADFDKQDEPEAPTRHKSARRLTEQGILSSVREWLVQDYASTYCRSLAAVRIYRRCYWVDAWGTGRERSDSGSAKSSHEAVLQPILSLSQVLAHENRPIALNGLVLTAGSSKRKEARAPLNGNTGTENLSASNRVKASLLKQATVHASWLEIGAALLMEIEHSPAVFLLNPFGHTLFTYDDLVPLFQRTSAPTELCLLVPHKQVELRLMAATHEAASASALTALLRTDRWKALLPKEEVAVETKETEHALDGLIDLLLSSVHQHFPLIQRIALPFQVRPTLVEAAPYTLLFATRSKDSLICMNDALCVYRRHLYRQSRQGVLGEEWFATQEQEQLAGEIQQLHQRTLQIGQSQRPRRWPDLRQQLLLANFGQFTLDEYDGVIGSLLKQGNVRCEWRRRPSEDEQGRAPGNEDTLLWK